MELDRDRIEQLSAGMLAAIRDNYLAGPSSRDRVWEALNALAFAAATVIAGTDDRSGRREARAFFDKGMDQNLRDLVAKTSPK